MSRSRADQLAEILAQGPIIPVITLDRLEDACRGALEDATVRRVLATSRSPVSFVPRAELTRMIHAEYANYGRILRELGVEPQ